MTMRTSSAILGSVLFFVAAPGIVAGLVPWLVTRWAGLSPSLAVIIFAAIVIAAALAVLLHAFARFALEGSGTPAPVAPTEELVVGGIYRYVRNPMYLAVVSLIAGQALLFESAALLVYGVGVAMAMVGFAMFYEEPTLARRYGASYERYRRAVPGWLPRLTPWQGQ